MSSQSMNFKLDGELKQQFIKLADDLGLTSTNMLTMYVKRAVAEQGIPFDVKVTSRASRLYETLYAEEYAKINKIIPDDAEIISENDLNEYRGLYK